MKVAHFSTSDIMGGAAKATHKLHKQLLKLNIDSRLFVKYILNLNPEQVFSLENEKGIYAEKIKPRIRAYIYKQLKEKYPIDEQVPFTWNYMLHNYPMKEEFIRTADIIGLYYIGDFLNPENLKNIHQPIVWRMSDIWPFTGGCHYSGNCKKYETGCGACPVLKSIDNEDFSHKLIKRKLEAWKDLNLTITAPSKWIGELAGNSLLFKGKRVEVIKSGVNENLFKPLDKSFARRALNIPEDCTLILFGSDSIIDPRKGMKYLKGALQIIKGRYKQNISIGLFGSHYDPEMKSLGMETYFFGHTSETFLPLLYNAANVFVAPSLEENLANTVIESISCGIPAVTFNIGGMPDMINENKNGRMAENISDESLAEAIMDALENQISMGAAGREFALQNHQQEVQAGKYVKLYEELLQK